MAPPHQDEWLERVNTIADATGMFERRRSFRTPLHWTLYMARDGRTHPQRTETKNLSRDGFYCLLNEPLIVGEHFDCDIVVPTHAPAASSAMFLRCRVQVMRVEKVDSGDRYGLACRIEEYRVIHKAAGLVQNGRQHHDT